jgi:hypothetical protein
MSAPLIVANARHVARHGCALRLDRNRPGAPLGRVRFIHRFHVVGQHRQRLVAPFPEPAGIGERLRHRREAGIDIGGMVGSEGQAPRVEHEARHPLREQAGVVRLDGADHVGIDRKADPRPRRRQCRRRQGALAQGGEQLAVQTLLPCGAGGWAFR